MYLLKEKIDPITNEYSYRANINVSADKKHPRYVELIRGNWYLSNYKKGVYALFKLRDAYIHHESKLLTLEFDIYYHTDGTSLDFYSSSIRVPRSHYHTLRPYIHEYDDEPKLIDCMLIDTNRLKTYYGK